MISANKCKLAAIFLIIMVCHFSAAQVPNNDIDKRIELKVNSPAFLSNTTDCTVDWACVDESLTGKCIEYHNDQWFWFKTNQAGKYYININGQQCRDTRGVQLVVIDGVPCQPKTYKILTCTSLATQDDIFVELQALQANHSYLINIDGYLKDFCSFQVQVSTQPRGLPVQPIKDKVLTTNKIVEDVVQLEWTITEDLSEHIHAFQVFRRKDTENRFSEIKTMPHEKNTFGRSKLIYSITDTVPANGVYFYKIIAAEPDGVNLLLSETSVNYSSLNHVKTNPADYITLHLDYKTGTPISLYIYDANSKRLLNKVDFSFKDQDRQLTYYIGSFKSRGISAIDVRIIDNDKKVSRTKFFSLN